MQKRNQDLYQAVTDKIIAAIEAGAADFVMPWHRGESGSRPRNALTGSFYQGINILNLWVEAQARGYASNLWGSYRQWAELGAQVRRGETSSLVIFYKQIIVRNDKNEEETRPVARATPVFNLDQVDGYAAPAAQPPADVVDTDATAEAFIAATAAHIVCGGAQAFHSPSSDTIHIPDKACFTGSPTSTPTDAYYSTLYHELTHWSGAKGRCERDLSGRFGTAAYAMEELVAELGAAFLCAELGSKLQPRPDHAHYINNWLQVLKKDRKAIFSAASSASKAVEFLRSLSGEKKLDESA